MYDWYEILKKDSGKAPIRIRWTAIPTGLVQAKCADDLEWSEAVKCKKAEDAESIGMSLVDLSCQPKR